MNFLGRFARYIDVLFIGMAVAISFYTAVEVPVSDDWDIVPFIQKMKEGTLDWKTLDSPYGGHKEPVSRFVLALTAVATHWNTYVFRTINILLYVGMWLAIRPVAVRKGQLLAAAVVFWSLNQWIMWAWTAQMSESMAIFCVIWSLRLLQDQRWRSLIPAIILAVAGTFCHGAGLGVWPAAFYLMFFTNRRATQRVVFGAVALLTMYLYLFQYPAPQGDLVMGHNYFHMPVFLLLALGAPMGFAAKGMAAFIALVGLVMLLMSHWWKNMRKEPFITAVFLASLSMMGLVMVARGGWGDVGEGMNGRFGTCAALFWAGLILLSDWPGWKRYCLAGLLGLCVIKSAVRVPGMDQYRQRQKAAEYAILNWTPERRLLKGAWTDPEQFDADIKLMQQWHYSFFRNR